MKRISTILSLIQSYLKKIVYFTRDDDYTRKPTTFLLYNMMMLYKSFLCSIGHTTYCVLDLFRLNYSYYIGKFTTKREGFKLSEKDTFWQNKTQQNKQRKQFSKGQQTLFTAIELTQLNAYPLPPQLRNFHLHRTCVFTYVSVCAGRSYTVYNYHVDIFINRMRAFFS